MNENEAPLKCKSNEEKDDKIEKNMVTPEVKISINDDENKESIEVSLETLEPHNINETERIKNRGLDKIPDVVIENQMEATNDTKTITVYMEYPYQQHQYPSQQVYAQQPQQVFAQQPQQVYAFETQPQQGSPPTPHIRSFEYTTDKNGFVRKVFLLVFIMMTITGVITFVVYISDDIQDLLQSMEGYVFVGICLVALVIVNCAIACKPDVTKKVPWNFIVIFTGNLAFSFIVAFISSMYHPQVVLGAVTATMVTLLLCLALAFTSFDFTKYLLIVVVVGAALALGLASFGVLYVLQPGESGFENQIMLGLLVVATIVCCVTIVIELQMILGGKKVELSEDDWVFAAYLVYSSLIDLFIKMLQLVAAASGDSKD